MLPYGISKISGAAFRCSSITEIIMPQSITISVFVNSFISTVYGLKGRKMMARIL